MAVRACAIGIGYALRRTYNREQQPKLVPSMEPVDTRGVNRIRAATVSSMAANAAARATASAADTIPEETKRIWLEHQIKLIGETLRQTGAVVGMSVNVMAAIAPTPAIAYAADTAPEETKRIWLERQIKLVGEELRQTGTIVGMRLADDIEQRCKELIHDFGKELDKPIDRMDQVAHDSLMQLGEVVRKIQIALELPGGVGELSDAISELSLVSATTSIRHISDAYFPAGGSSAIVKMRGNFPQIARGGKAVLTIGDVNIKASLATSHDLQFPLDRATFPPGESVTQLQAAVRIFNSEKCLINPSRLSDPAEATFNDVPIQIFPTSPGTIQVLSRAPRTYTRTASPPRRVDLQQKANTTQVHTISPREGWQIVPGSSKIVSEHCTPFEADDPVIKAGSLTYKVQSGECKRCHYSRAMFHVEYLESQTVTETVKTQQRRVLEWGESIVYDLPEKASVKVIYTCFNGTRMEMMGTDHNNPYVWVTRRGNQMKVTVKDPFAPAVPMAKL